MKKLLFVVCLLAVLTTSFALPVMAKDNATDEDTMDVKLVVTPKVLQLGARKGTVTAQVKIKFADVDPGSITMNGVTPILVKQNNKGYLVVKFNLAQILALASPPSINFVLTGVTKSGMVFTGVQTIQVQARK